MTLVNSSPTINVSSSTLTIGGPIGDGGDNLGLTKAGTGTLVLGGSNNYGGTTAINGGLLSLANAAALAGGGNLTFGGGTLQFNAANIYSTNNVVSSTAAIRFDINGSSATFAGTLASTNTAGLTLNSTAGGGISGPYRR